MESGGVECLCVCVCFLVLVVSEWRTEHEGGVPCFTLPSLCPRSPTCRTNESEACNHKHLTTLKTYDTATTGSLGTKIASPSTAGIRANIFHDRGPRFTLTTLGGRSNLLDSVFLCLLCSG